jgi:alkanesulfonate monooxygenase SsuD/methylene tetrahydromethanopterin reductase-like flavin-dependent oxidoreductase (luciferase family)
MEVRGREPHFGVQLQAQTSSWAEYAVAVRTVEELGFGSVWNVDHMLPVWGDVDRPCFETLTTLSAMALLTEHVRIGVLVNGVLYRDPVTLAKAAAQVDHMSGGRLEFSLGAAWAQREFQAYGLEFPSMAERYERLEEALQVVELLWSQRRSTFHGRYYHLDDAPCQPKPLQAPHPPITIGGVGLGSLRIAARHANRLNLIGAPEKCAERIAKLEALCAQASRDPNEIEYSVHPTAVVASTATAADDLARDLARAQGADLELQRQQWLIGDPDAVAARLRPYLDAGISHFVFAIGSPFDAAQLKLLRDDVIPALA